MLRLLVFLALLAAVANLAFAAWTESSVNHGTSSWGTFAVGLILVAQRRFLR